MKMINYILIPFFLILSSFNKIQQSEGDYIIWSKDRKLQWKDFQGIPDQREIALGTVAETWASLSVEFKMENNDFIIYNISSIFIIKKSWKIEQTAYILNHEQKHFDIFEVCSRKFRKEISNYIETSGDDTMNQLFQQLSNKYSNLAHSMGVIYDKETNHSKNIEAQERWNKKIDSLLVTLDAYNSPRIIIKRNHNNNSNKDVQKNTKSSSPFQSVFK